MVPSSTIMESGHALLISASLVTISPSDLTSAPIISKARLPIGTATPSARSSRVTGSIVHSTMSRSDWPTLNIPFRELVLACGLVYRQVQPKLADLSVLRAVAPRKRKKFLLAGERDQKHREAAMACSFASPITCAMKAVEGKILENASSRMLKPPVYAPKAGITARSPSLA